MKVYDFLVKQIDGGSFDFNTLKGKKLLIVNVASECGFTNQYAAMQEMHEELGGDKFQIIGFPCNDFGAQEPGTESEIATFCQKNYGVTFPLMEKISILGEEVHPLYKWLQSKTGVEVKWNFYKFLIDEKGNVRKGFPSSVAPNDPEIIDWILND